MNEQTRPSKQFLIRGSIATGIIAVVLIVQTDWFRALFDKAPLPPITDNKTVGDFIAKDSNGNGIPDWEEKLWGLDPTALYTDGVPNKQVIEDRKKTLGITAPTEPENETDALARELLTITAALGTSGEFTSESLAAVGARLAESVEFQTAINHYSLKDLSVVQTTSDSLRRFYLAFGTIAKKHESSASEIDILAQALESGDFSSIDKLAPIKKEYETYAKELVALSVPIGLQGEHLEIINSIYGMSVALDYVSELSDNGTHALAGIALYKISDARLFAASDSMHKYFVRYGILSQ